jgi:hypothetical protein
MEGVAEVGFKMLNWSPTEQQEGVAYYPSHLRPERGRELSESITQLEKKILSHLWSRWELVTASEPRRII